ncbi:hypothetical protein [Pusillimonas sp. ANT_WB101]|uniref:hypothetical protein n=1 Tax=Pusillimonas sp. ANT_WB101 TaxID=2597356 RepID=UPI0011ED1020|nr:hypothetical protein [Pusillimonas sp. ANT_WB101]KAA0910421.1 hypothetical protein FQ179_00525 [Pusillimonas sp. ANT_WB101]
MGDTKTASSGTSLAQHFAHVAAGHARNRSVNAIVLLQFEQAQLLVQIQDGRVTEVLDTFPPLASWDFAIKADADTWSRLWQVIPEAGSHDIFALAKNGHMRIEGNLHPLMAHLQYMKDLLALGRRAAE